MSSLVERNRVNLSFVPRVVAAMTMTEPIYPRAIAHSALALTEPPYLKHYPRARFKVWNGVAFTTSSLPGPGFNFAAVLHPYAPSLDDLLPVAREFFSHCEQGWGVQVEGDVGHAMEAELLARGWTIAEDEPAFVMESLTPAVRRERRPVSSSALFPTRPEWMLFTIWSVRRSGHRQRFRSRCGHCQRSWTIRISLSSSAQPMAKMCRAWGIRGAAQRRCCGEPQRLNLIVVGVMARPWRGLHWRMPRRADVRMRPFVRGRRAFRFTSAWVSGTCASTGLMRCRIPTLAPRKRGEGRRVFEAG